MFVLLASCQELPRYFSGDQAIAHAVDRELRLRDVAQVVPQGVTGQDSTALMKAYVDRWVRRQLKVAEAEELFKESAGDIDKMVEEYRQALLIRKLDQHYVDMRIDTTFTEEQISQYYESHKSDFKLDRTIVKGRIVRLPDGHRQAAKVKTLMGSKSAVQQQDFSDLCEKNNFEVSDFRAQWVDFQDFLACMPTLRSVSYTQLLGSTAVQEMRDSRSRYFFQIESVLREGDYIPLERLVPTIRRILFNRRQAEVIRLHEDELYAKGIESGEVRTPFEERIAVDTLPVKR